MEAVSSESGRKLGGAGGRAREGWELYSCHLAMKRRGPPGVSFLTPSSPCCSLDPPRAGGVRAYRGEHLWGVAGSELEGLFNVLLR